MPKTCKCCLYFEYAKLRNVVAHVQTTTVHIKAPLLLSVAKAKEVEAKGTAAGYEIYIYLHIQKYT